ncbi:MAG: hypothetical protein RLO50_15445 [Azospirillaceae bacterium]
MAEGTGGSLNGKPLTVGLRRGLSLVALLIAGAAGAALAQSETSVGDAPAPDLDLRLLSPEHLMPDQGNRVAGDVNGRITGTEDEVAGRLFARLPVIDERDWYLMLHGELDFSLDGDEFGNDHYAATIGGIYRRALTERTAVGFNVFTDIGEYGDESQGQVSLGFEVETVWPDEAAGDTDSWFMGGNFYFPFEDYTADLPARAPRLGGDLYTGTGYDWDFQRLEATLTGFFYNHTDTAEDYYGGALDLGYRYYDLEDVLPVGSHLFAGVGVTYDNFHEDAEFRGEVGLTITFDDGRDGPSDVPRYERVAEVRRNIATGSPFIPVEPTPMWSTAAAGSSSADLGCGPGNYGPVSGGLLGLSMGFTDADLIDIGNEIINMGETLGDLVLLSAITRECLGFSDCIATLSAFNDQVLVTGGTFTFSNTLNAMPPPICIPEIDFSGGG